jgi:hypothetical protein
MTKPDRLEINRLKASGIKGDYPHFMPKDLIVQHFESEDVDEVIQNGLFVNFRASIEVIAALPLQMEEARLSSGGEKYPIQWHDADAVEREMKKNGIPMKACLNQYFRGHSQLRGRKQGTISGYFRAPGLLPASLESIILTLELEDQFRTVHTSPIEFLVEKTKETPRRKREQRLDMLKLVVNIEQYQEGGRQEGDSSLPSNAIALESVSIFEQ